MAATEELKNYDSRPYQIDLYKAAKERNIIACLGTGTGKTFISILLMSDSQFLPQLNGSYRWGRAKRTFFLVPTRPLVHQQTLSIKTAPQTSVLKVKGFTGDMNVDFWDEEKWLKELEENQVIVMTPQILLDMLSHSYITFDRINLLVFDEVHWAARKKNKKESGHSYKQLMKRYHELPDPNSRPRVLGLSATPINCSMRVENFYEAVEDIEKTYGAVCMTGDVSTYGTNPKESIWCFTNLDSYLSRSGTVVVNSLQIFIESLKGTLKGFKDQRKCPTVLMRMKKILVTIRNILSDPQMNERTVSDEQTGEKYPLFMTWMGVWCASIAVDFYVKEIGEYKQVYENVDQPYADLWGKGQKYLQQIQRTLAPEIISDPMAPLNTASPKMHRLLELLLKYRPIGGQESALCGIVFVNQRCVAKVLCDWLTRLGELRPHLYGFLNVGWVVGHAARPGIEVKIASNSDKKQKEVIQRFHDKHLNLLVATSVLEEGLDVRKCNLVIRYDRINTFREYLQSKGRARAEDANYYMMTADEDSHKLWSKLNDFRQMEEMVKNINNKPTNGSPKVAEGEDDDEKDLDLILVNDKTGAKVGSRQAIALLYKCCQKLPSDCFTQLEPVFTVEKDSILGRFRGTVKLPANCPLKGAIVGRKWKKTSELAKKAVAIQACRQLHEIGELNDNLLPINKEETIEVYVQKLGLRKETLISDQEGRKEPTKAKMGTRSRKDTIAKKVAQVFIKDNQNNGYYLNRIGIEFPKTDSLPNNCLTFGVLTPKPIDKRCLFSIYLKTIWREVLDDNQSSEVKVDFYPITKLFLSEVQKESIEKFHCFTFEEVMRFSLNDYAFDSNNSEFNLLIVPLMNGIEVNWTFIDKINTFGPIEVRELSDTERQRYQFNVKSFNDSIFYPYYRKDLNGRPFVYYSLRFSDLNSRSQWIAREGTTKDYKTFADYFLDKYEIDIKNKNLPLIEGRALNKREKGLFKGSQLKPYFTGKKDKRNPEFYPPELLSIHPFPASLWRQALCLPAVFFRLNHLYLAEEMRLKIHLETYPRIGSFDLRDNRLNLNIDYLNSVSNSVSNSDSKRGFDSMDSDDECEGHQFIDDMDVDFHTKLSHFKKQKKEITISGVPSNSTPNRGLAVSSSLNQFNIGVGGGDLFSILLEYTNALIYDFKRLVMAYVNRARSQSKEDLFLEQILDEIYRPKAEISDIIYGEAFPFVFKGNNIESFIRDKYDATVGDPILGPSSDLILQALTMVGATDAFNLERLEVIGDSFLKLVSSAYVYFSCPELDEGRLSYLRQIQICNCNLYLIGREKGIGELLVSHKWFPNTNWLPPSYHISDEKDLKILRDEVINKKKNDQNKDTEHKNLMKRTDSFKHMIVNNKSIADSVEALIGAHLIIGGTKSALIFMEWLGLKVKPLEAPDIDYLNEKGLPSGELFQWLPSPQNPICRPDVSQTDIDEFIKEHYECRNLKFFEQIIGYSFNNKAYLIQALTHSSYHFNEYTPCYQKLEFLGDSIIDYLISRHIFATPNKSFSPGELTDLRSALVNNAFFAAIAVKYKFHKFLKNLSLDLFRAIQSFEKNFSAGEKESVIDSFNKLTEEECTDFEVIEVPKALGDIFESVAGAIYLDNGMSLDGVWKVYFRLLKPEIDYFTKNIPIMPVQQIWTKYANKGVKFGESEKSGRKTRVVLTVNGKQYGGVGKNRKFAKIAASKNALKDLKQ